MSECQTCGRPAENGVPTHWLGCGASQAQRDLKLSDLDEHLASEKARQCEHEGCSQPKKDWSGRGARPKFCAAGHK